MRVSGAHGVVYASGVRTGGRVAAYEALQGRRIRAICGGRGQFVAVVDAWDLDWQPSRDRSQVLEHETVALGLKGGVKVQQVAFGERHRVAVTLDGHLYSWGARDASFTTGELGHVASAWHPVTLTPRGVAAGNKAEASAKEPTMVKTSTKGGGPDRVHPHQAGNLTLDDDDNQFGDRDDASFTSVCWPRRVHTPQQLFFTKVACGAQHSVALTDKGDLYAWGRNFQGQLGVRHTSSAAAPMCAWPKYVSALLGRPAVVDVACGDAFTVALLADGSAWQWGERVAGTTGRSAPDKIHARPRRLLLTSSSTEDTPFVTGIAAGTAHALGVTASGALHAWGLNAYGQLGLGRDRRGSSDTPCRVPGTTVWTKVFAGSHYSAAIASDGQLFTWGHGRHGTLGHASTECEFAPRAVDALRGVSVASVVCGQLHLFAFAPTVVTSITPTAGETTGGYELRVRGSGFWESDELTVRFVPLTEGRLPRGALATFDPTTREIVCTVPAFSLPGEFAVELATDGKHFTTDGHVFEVFKRPSVVRVSRWEARIAGGEEVEIAVEGALPRSCTTPLLGLVVEGGGCIQVPGTLEASACSLPALREEHDATTTTPSVGPTLLRFVLPPSLVGDTAAVVRCPLQLSFNGGHQFTPVALDTSTTTPFVFHLHDAAVTRCRPNSFQARALPTTLELDVHHLLTPTTDWSELSVALRVAPLNVSDATAESRVDVALTVQRVTPSSTNDSATITCVVPPLNEWKLSKVNPKTDDRVVIVTDWWKFVPRWGFDASVRVSMNGGQSLLPVKGGAVYGVFTTGKAVTASPLTTPLTGGTLVSVAADSFHFDTDDAVVALRWKDQREVRVAAKCSVVSSDAINSSAVVQSLTRRLTFTTAALPFPRPPHSPPPPLPEGDEATPLPVEEPTVSDDALGLAEEVEVLLSLDGRHFQRESRLRITYIRSPELLEIFPSEVPPATRMVLKVDKVPPPSAALTTACVRLTTATLGLSTVRRQTRQTGRIANQHLCSLVADRAGGSERSGQRVRVCGAHTPHRRRRHGARGALARRPAVFGRARRGRWHERRALPVPRATA
jgi:alpha-tubulin suppressor-like RCC1 family protein